MALQEQELKFDQKLVEKLLTKYIEKDMNVVVIPQSLRVEEVNSQLTFSMRTHQPVGETRVSE
jgi:hypothetical protein